MLSRHSRQLPLFMLLMAAMLACGPSKSDQAKFIELCKNLSLSEAKGWIDPKFGPFDFHRSAPVPGLDYGGEPPPFVAVARVSGRGLDGRRQTANATCSGFESGNASITTDAPTKDTRNDADRAWLHAEVLARARAAEQQKAFSNVIALLRGNGALHADTSEWIKEDPDYRDLLARALKEQAEDDKVRARQRAEDLRKQAAEDKVRAREQAAGSRQRAKEEREARRDYASNLRTHFLDTGADIEVSVTGNNADRLVLRYVLFNAVWVRKFQTGNLIDEIRAKGFKSVKFDDKYNYSWTIPLQ
jgi:hypothetical protein